MKTLTCSGICLLAILMSCSKDNELNSTNQLVSLDQTKTSLANTIYEDDPITKVVNSSALTTLLLESGNSIVIDNKHVEKVVVDSIHWRETFFFSDKSRVDAEIVGSLNLVPDSVIINPFGTSPLTALAKITTPVNGSFKVIVHGKGVNGVAISKSFGIFGIHHRLPILGLYENYDNQVEFILMSAEGKPRCSKTITLRTAALPSKPSISINVNNLGTDYGGTFIVGDLNLGFDQNGDIRWSASPISPTGIAPTRKLNNGNMLFVAGDGKSFVEATMLGEVIHTYSVPTGIHHDIIEMPNGNFLVTSNSGTGKTVEDVIIEINRSSGSLTKVWDLSTILDPSRKPLPDAAPGDWFHMNSLFFDPTDNSIIVSGRSQSAVVKLDYETGSLRWILGNPAGWNQYLAGYTLNAIDNSGNRIDVSSIDFWSYGQHAVQRLANGNILMYDDGDFRGFFDNASAPQRSYTRGVEYAIDEKNMTVRLVWEFDNDKSIFTPYTGFIQQLSSSRVLAYMDGAISGNGPKVVEIDASNQILFDADFNAGAFYYRAAKYDLYAGIE